MKRAIRYLRFSQKGQSNGSIERQELYTDQWILFNKVELVDTFIDRGKSARTFDRPDFKKLQEFIARHHRSVDYLLVDQFDRFSRDAGEAMSMVKKLQHRYSIQVVSVTEGITFDYHTPGSFFRAGLQLLLAEEDNINRSIKVRGGVYTAKAKEGRFIFKIPPFGYKKEGERKERKLIVDETEAKIVRFIFDAYLKGVPLYKIKEKAYQLGFDRKGNIAVERVLSNPAYAGLLYVEPYKEYPGGLFPAIHEPIIDITTWKLVQAKMKKPEKYRAVIDDALPLRGILKCHCGSPISGAASKGKTGRHWHYYKCRFPRHTNLSAVKAHQQLEAAIELMSLPEKEVQKIIIGSEAAIEKKMADNKQKIREKKVLLENTQEKLFQVEEKWIKNEINRDTYQRWYSNYNDTILELKGAIERYSQDPNHAFAILNKNLPLLTDMKFVYTNCNTLQKREFISLGFDNNLYYQDGMFRTPTMMDVLATKSALMAERGLLIYEKNRDSRAGIPLSGEEGIRTLETLSSLHTFQACQFNHSCTSPVFLRDAKITV